MDIKDFIQPETSEFVGTAAANTIGLVIGYFHFRKRKKYFIKQNIRIRNSSHTVKCMAAVLKYLSLSRGGQSLAERKPSRGCERSPA